MFYRYSHTVRVISLFCVSIVLLACFFSPWGSLPVSIAETEKSLAKIVQQLQQKLLNYQAEIQSLQQQQTQLQTKLHRNYTTLHQQHLELLGRYEALQQRVLSLESMRLLWIQTRPPGATVWINGKRQPGVTPMLRSLPTGQYQLKVTLAGHFDHNQPLDLEGASSSETMIPLKPKKFNYRLMVSVNKSPVEVRLGKKLVAILTTIGTQTLRVVGWAGQTATLKFIQTRTLESVERDVTWPEIEDVVVPGVEFSVEEEISIPSIQAKATYIPAGTFMMGSLPNEWGHQSNEVQHKVKLSRGFWMMKTEVTHDQFKNLMEYSPSPYTCQGKGGNCPVVNVRWHEAAAFANTLSRKEGLQECFVCHGSQTNVTCSGVANYLRCKGWRLPTEAEWEYAARAGTTTLFSTGNCIATDQANYDGRSNLPQSCPSGSYRYHLVEVSSFAPNAWGLHDMHGNVWEWVYDWYGSYNLSIVPAVDPAGASNGSQRVIRGGSWNYLALSLRSAYRGRSSPSDASVNVGFRLSRSLP